MSTNGILFITTLVGLKLILQSWLISRQRKAIILHRNEVPEAFKNYFSLEEHQKAADYSLARLKFSLISSFFSNLLLLTWFVSGGLALLDAILFMNIPSSVWQPLALIASVIFIDSILGLPFSLYSQFVIEEKFGFNRTNLKTFFTDRLKGIVVGSILGLAIGYPFVLTMNEVPGFWFAPAYIFYSLFQLFIMLLWPTVIAPLFNKFSPLQDESLAQGIKSLVENAGFKSNGVYVMDASKRSSHGNAYFTGIGKAKRIVFFDTLLSKISIPQTLAVLAHEIGHLAHGHIRKGMMLSFAMSAVAFTLLGWFAMRVDYFIALGLAPTHGVVLIVAGWLGSLLATPLSPLMARWSRKHEFQS
ncbi:MAG: M48 family metallopeptidase, partial [Bacteriovoracaceae bacterium]|nr:M48 family metallopeptidase [Bacteriovoracaceae bacterium]